MRSNLFGALSKIVPSILRNPINLSVGLWRGVVLSGFVLGCGLLQGCSGLGGGDVINAGTSCIGDSGKCISRREAALNAMLGDQTRAWVYDVPRGSAYLTGVRAFAYQKTMNKLSCKELRHGMKEMAAAPSVLARDDPSNDDPAQLSRAKILSASVHRSLKKRFRRKCQRKG